MMGAMHAPEPTPLCLSPPDQASTSVTSTNGSSATEDVLSQDAYYEYLDNVTDAVTRRSITEDTELARIYLPPSSDTFTKSRATLSIPHVPAQLIHNNELSGELDELPNMPLDGKASWLVEPQPGLSLYVAFMEVLYAPAVCLLLKFRQGIDCAEQRTTTAWLAIPFTGDGKLENLTITSASESAFTVIDLHFQVFSAVQGDGGYSLRQLYPVMSQVDQRLLDLITGLSRSDNSQQVHLKLRLESKYGSSLVELDENDTVHKILKHLPGNAASNFVPSSFTSLPYAAFREPGGNITVAADGMLQPIALRYPIGGMSASPPAPMTPMFASNVFTSVDSARVKLAYGVDLEYRQDKIKLELLGEGKHSMRLVSFGSIVVALIKLDPCLPRIDAHSSTLPRITDGTAIDLSWISSSGSEEKARGVAGHLPVFIPNHDLSVLLTNRDTQSVKSKVDKYTELFRQSISKTTAWRETAIPVSVCIKPIDSVYGDNMEAIDLLTSTLCATWHSYLLNQTDMIAALPSHDSTQAKRDDMLEQEWLELVNKRWSDLRNGSMSELPGFKWNAEQAEVLEKLRSNRGKILSITGPAGTGKTELMLQILCFYYRLGYHIIFNAPANSNVEDFCTRLRARYGDKIPFVRPTPRWIEDEARGQASGPGRAQPSMQSFKDAELFEHLSQSLVSNKRKYESSRSFHLTALVINAADTKQYGSFFIDRTFQTTAKDVDVDSVANTVGKLALGQEHKDAEPHPNPCLRCTPVQGCSEVADGESTRSSDAAAVLPKPMPLLSDLEGLPNVDPPKMVRLPVWGSHLLPNWSCKKYQDRYYFIDIDNFITDRDPRHSQKIDLWQVFRALLAKSRQQPMHKWVVESQSGLITVDSENQYLFQFTFDKCIEYVLAHHRVACATSSGACNRLMRSTFASGKYESTKCTGMVVITDEAAKDTEPNFWGPVVQLNWTNKVQLVLACGDVHQLQPTIMGAASFNPFRDQLSRSFFKRYIEEGGAHVELLEQSRMNSHIAHFPGKFVYNGKLRTAAHRYKDIEFDIPRLRDSVLIPLFKNLGYGDGRLAEHIYRAHSFRVRGACQRNHATKSRYNLEQIEFAVRKILPYQIGFFGAKTSEKCLWIAGYTETVRKIERRLFTIQSSRRVSRAYMPSVLTIDNSQGCEADWVVLFSTCNTERELGFMADNNRINVATTRAKNVFSYIHGAFDYRLVKSIGEPSDGRPMSPMAVAYAKYLEMLQERDSQSHRVGRTWSTQLGSNGH